MLCHTGFIGIDFKNSISLWLGADEICGAGMNSWLANDANTTLFAIVV